MVLSLSSAATLPAILKITSYHPGLPVSSQDPLEHPTIQINAWFSEGIFRDPAPVFRYLLYFFKHHFIYSFNVYFLREKERAPCAGSWEGQRERETEDLK